MILNNYKILQRMLDARFQNINKDMTTILTYGNRDVEALYDSAYIQDLVTANGQDLKGYDGTNFPGLTSSSTSWFLYSLASQLLIGSGTTDADIKDYKMENLITTLTFESQQSGYTSDGYYLSMFMTNNTSSNIAISEIGTTTYSNTATPNSTASKSFLTTRTVLSTPKTLVPGQSTKVVVKFSFSS